MIRASRSVPLVVLILALVVMLGACSRDKAESKAPPATAAVPVAVAPVEQKAMPLQIQAIGTVEALSVVSVRAQVGGAADDWLFENEPLPKESPLWAHSKVTISPHISGVTSVEGATAGFLHALEALERGERPDTAVDVARGY